MVVVVDGVRLVAKSSCIDMKSVRRVGQKGGGKWEMGSGRWEVRGRR